MTTSENTTAAVIHDNIGDALAAFQRAVPTIKKGNTAKVTAKEGGSSYSYAYADLTDVTEIVLPLLAAQGLAWHTGLDTNQNGDLILRWRLIHGATGERLKGRIPVGRAGARWQDLGSAITYARRYALTAATGVAPGGDDDDAPGHQTPPAERQSPIAEPPQILPVGLYDLSTLDTVEKTGQVFQTAQAAGHLHLLVAMPDATGEIRQGPLGSWLRMHAQRLQQNVADQADASEAAEAAAVAAHEAAEGAQ